MKEETINELIVFLLTLKEYLKDKTEPEVEHTLFEIDILLKKIAEETEHQKPDPEIAKAVTDKFRIPLTPLTIKYK